MNDKKKIVLPVIIFIILIIVSVGVTYAFFNYTRTGLVNTISVGRIYFNHEQGNAINLSNVFPISSEQAENDTVNAKTLSISVIGDTDYDGGIEYVVTLDSVNNNKNIPINLEVSVSGNGLGTEEIGDYYTNRESYTESKYKIEYNGRFEQDRHILVGYISPNTTKGTIEGINGTINIKAYIDSDKVLISDTYPEGTAIIDGVEYYNGTPTIDKMVLTTEEWNSITGSNALSFKIMVEAREGIWVEKETTPASCFSTTPPTLKYVRNPNMNVNTCISKLTDLWGEEVEGKTVDTGETYEAFCNGTGTNFGDTLQDLLDNYGFNSSELTELETAGIITNLGYTTEITHYDASCGSDVIIPSKINNEFVTSYVRNSNMNINTCISKLTEWLGEEEEGNTVDTGETYESFCNGTGTNWGYTLQDLLDNNSFNSSQLTELETARVIIANVTNVDIEIIGIGDSAFYNKNLTSVTIPNSVTTIGNNAFSGNDSLTKLEIDMLNISGNFASGQGIYYLTNLTIGNNVTTIGDYAFSNIDLTGVTIPNSVTTIGEGAFKYNSLLYIKVPNNYFNENFSHMCKQNSLVELSNINLNNIRPSKLYYKFNNTNSNIMFLGTTSGLNFVDEDVKIINATEDKYCFASDIWNE